MEDKYPIKEIKVLVYIQKPEKKSNNDAKNDTNKNQYHKIMKIIINVWVINHQQDNGKDELIKIYEIEFKELRNRVLSLFQ